MARHASDSRRRGVATWPIVTAAVVVVLVAAIIAYALIVNRGEDAASAPTCSDTVTLPVAASPGAAVAMETAARSFDATEPTARSACVTTAVSAIPGQDAEAALAAGWATAAGAAPAIWAVDTEADLLELETTNSALTAGRNTTPIAGSPVVIAVRSGEEQSVAGRSWTDLLGGAAPPVLALPDPRTSRATSYALQSMVATGDTAVDPAAVTAAAPQIAALAAPLPPAEQPPTTSDALTRLANATGGFTAVPVVESDLARFSATRPGGPQLVALYPPGPTAGDRIFPVPLSASWVDPTLKEAGAVFLAYLRSPEGSGAFVDAGLRLTAPTSATVTASPVPGVDTAVAVQPLPDGGSAVAEALAQALGYPPG